MFYNIYYNRANKYHHYSSQIYTEIKTYTVHTEISCTSICTMEQSQITYWPHLTMTNQLQSQAL